MKQPAPHFRYRLLSLLLLPFWVVHALIHGLRNHENQYLWQRLGLVRYSPQDSIWIHASSVGEVTLIEPLVRQLVKQTPVTVTTFTASGYQHAQRILPGAVLIRVLPIDFWPLARRFLRGHGFRLGLVAETELWPEILYQASALGLPLLQINARMSKKTLHANQLLKPLIRRTLQYFDAFLTRHESDGANLEAMGVAADHIRLCGNLKQATPEIEPAYPCLIKRPYLLFASTHAPEEENIINLMQTMKWPLLCVIAPRHPQRAAELMAIIQRTGLSVAQRSAGQEINADTHIYLADTLGELRALLQHAELVVMGGSFNTVGGHNVLEATALGKAVITGPADSNINDDIKVLQRHDAIIQVDGYPQLQQQLQRLLEHPDQRAALEENARKATRARADVLTTYLQTIDTYLR